jgi:hypothetical protein
MTKKIFFFIVNNQYIPRKEPINERHEVDKQSELGFQTRETTCSRLKPPCNLYHQDHYSSSTAISQPLV